MLAIISQASHSLYKQENDVYKDLMPPLETQFLFLMDCKNMLTGYGNLSKTMVCQSQYYLFWQCFPVSQAEIFHIICYKILLIRVPRVGPTPYYKRNMTNHGFSVSEDVQTNDCHFLCSIGPHFCHSWWKQKFQDLGNNLCWMTFPFSAIEWPKSALHISNIYFVETLKYSCVFCFAKSVTGIAPTSLTSG